MTSASTSQALIGAGRLLTLPRRPQDAHKQSSGAVVVVGGGPTMVGAPVFVALGALRVGCGLVRLAVPAAIHATCLHLVPAAIALPTDRAGRWLRTLDPQAVVAFGPGMGADASARRRLAALIARGQRLVIDGGGLGLLAHLKPENLRPGQAVLTPHAGEYARLALAWGLPGLGAGGPAARERAARALARCCRGSVVLKGPGTLIAAGNRLHRDGLGGPELAIPGSGNVLTGIIAALWAAGLEPFLAAELGVRLHSLAGRAWARKGTVEGLLATELAALLPAAIAAHRRRRR